MNYKTYFEKERIMFPEYIDTLQMMQMCRINKNSIYKWLYSGDIRYERIYSVYRIERDSVLKYMYNKRNLQYKDKEYVVLLKNFYTKEFHSAPDVLSNFHISMLSGYAKSTINDWIAYGKLKSLSNSKKNLVPKSYFIDFMASKHAITNPMKSDKHKQLVEKFEREILSND